MPVIAPIAVDSEGQSLNVNADTVAGADGKVAHYEEVAMREPRKLDDLAAKVAKA